MNFVCIKKFWLYLGILTVFGFLAAQSVLAADFVDADADGLSDNEEIALYHTNPNNRDTDGDGYNDGEEIKNGYSPLNINRKKMTDIDMDHDGLNDALEIQLKTNIADPDTDGDGVNDKDEVYGGFNPLVGNKDRNVKREVEVDLTTQTLEYYFNNVSLGAMPVSTGILKTPTPMGEYEVMRKVPVIRYTGVGYDYPNTKWNIEFKRHFYLHTAYWHNDFGVRPRSHGCVNMKQSDVEKLYGFLDVGDTVKVVGKTPYKVAKK